MKTLSYLANLVNGKVVGDESMSISGVSEIQNGVESTITFLGNPKYKKYLASTNASAIIVNDSSLLGDKPGIIHSNPQLAVAKILEEFSQKLNLKLVLVRIHMFLQKQKLGKM